MSKEQMIAQLRVGKTGDQIMNILELLTSEISSETESEPTLEPIDF